MKCVIPRTALLSLIGKVQSIVPHKPALPILANVLVEAEEDSVVVSATDLTVSIRARAEARVEQSGGITLPARKLFPLIRELTAPMVNIDATVSEVAHIQAGSSHFRIHGVHRGDFPTLPDLSEGVSFTMHDTVLKEMFVRSSFAAARDDSRQVLNGVLLQSNGGVATFISTDGKRLARIHTSVPLPKDHIGAYILPLKAVEELVKILDAREDACSKVILTNEKLAIDSGATVVTTKLLGGSFPDVSRVIPEQPPLPVALHREELISLLRQVALFTSDTSGSVRFHLEPGELQLSAMSGEFGEGRVSMAVNYDGPPLDIACNPVYFLDILRHSKDETVGLRVSGSYSPVLITDTTDAFFLLMPMRL